MQCICWHGLAHEKLDTLSYRVDSICETCCFIRVRKYIAIKNDGTQNEWEYLPPTSFPHCLWASGSINYMLVRTLQKCQRLYVWAIAVRGKWVLIRMTSVMEIVIWMSECKHFINFICKSLKNKAKKNLPTVITRRTKHIFTSGHSIELNLI